MNWPNLKSHLLPCQFSMQNSHPATPMRFFHYFLWLWSTAYCRWGVKWLEDRSFLLKIHILCLSYVLLAWFWLSTSRSTPLCHSSYKGTYEIWFCLVKGICSADASQKDNLMIRLLDSSNQLQKHHSCLHLAAPSRISQVKAWGPVYLGALPRHKAATEEDSQQKEAHIFLTASPHCTVGLS